VKVLLGQGPVDAALPQLAPLRCRPSLERIAATVAEDFGQDAAAWVKGSRVRLYFSRKSRSGRSHGW